MLSTVIFGSVDSVADTSRLQRHAFNSAFGELGLNAYWNMASFCKVMESGSDLQVLSDLLGEPLSSGLAEEVLAAKQRHFVRLAPGRITPRPGVLATLAFCRKNDIRLAWVTTADAETVTTVVDALQGQLNSGVFDFITDRSWVFAPKPSPEIYHRALVQLGDSPHETLAIEDTQSNQLAALGADIPCFLYPSEFASTEKSVLLCKSPLDVVAAEHQIQHLEDTPYAVGMN